MRFDDGLDETEAKAEPTLRPARVAAKQAIPDPRQLVRRNPWSGVADGKQGGGAFAPDFHVHPAAARRVLDRVIDEIRCNLFQPSPVALDNGVGRVRQQSDRFGPRAGRSVGSRASWIDPAEGAAAARLA